MNEKDYTAAFKQLTGNEPFPWQRALYERFCSVRPDNIPATATLPTGLGKTMVMAVWLLALATAPKEAKVPRRLVYVVNRRTVVDQSTREAEKLRDNLPKCAEVLGPLKKLCASDVENPLAISTLRGQFADNREWSADPSRPAVICGTVDMIGSRLLFSGYGCGFRTRPLHAGFLGQDALLVHDEAHLEPAFQELIVAIEKEQERCKEFAPFRVLELTATARSAGQTFELTDDDRRHPVVLKRTGAKKEVRLHANKDEKKLAEELAALALQHKDSKRAVLVFVRKVDDVDKVVKKLPSGQVQQLTGTLRGYERDGLVRDPVFIRFLPEGDRPEGVEPCPGTVYLVCTSAGEVGVNISADHLVCDLSTFDSMAQRFGRVNRFGDRTDTRIDVVYPKELDPKDEHESRLKKTLGLLERLKGDGSPATLGAVLRQAAEEEGSGTEVMATDKTEPLRKYILSVFAKQPTILPTSDILFDAWALTTVRDKLPGRPPVEPYLHGVSGWEPPETHVAWREEVGEITGDLLKEYKPKDLLEEYPLKPHELLRDRSDRVFKHLVEIAKRHPDAPAWLVEDDGTVLPPLTLKELADKDERDRIARRTVLLPPFVGGLSEGFLSGGEKDPATDVSGALGNRARQWDNETPPEGMKRIVTIDTDPDREEAEEESTGRRYWYWFESQARSDGEDLNAAKRPVTWDTHTKDVTDNTTRIVNALPLPDEMRAAFKLAAKLHDLGKKRKVFQRVLGNSDPTKWLAKSGKKGGRVKEVYRHEFGSLLDAATDSEFQDLAEWQEFILHVIATHHGRGRPHFPPDEAFDPERPEADARAMASAVPQRFGRLQRRYGRWGLAYLESLLRAADYAASARPSKYEGDGD